MLASPLTPLEVTGLCLCSPALADEDLGEQGSHMEAAAWSQQRDGLTGPMHTLGSQILALLLLQRPYSLLLLLLGWSQAPLEQWGTLGSPGNVFAFHSAPAPPQCLVWSRGLCHLNSRALGSQTHSFWRLFLPTSCPPETSPRQDIILCPLSAPTRERGGGGAVKHPAACCGVALWWGFFTPGT